MKLTHKHITEDGLNALIDWSQDRVNNEIFKALHVCNLMALLELKQRRADDRQLGATNATE